MTRKSGFGKRLSVVLCTHNRRRSLERTLASLRETRVPEGLSWELIVVDNNSTDGTRDAVQEFARRAGMEARYVFEPVQGLSRARNRGVTEARGEIIAFTDDDVRVAEDWPAWIDRAFKESGAACVGGRILPVWEGTPPRWLTPELGGCLALLDYGDLPIELDHPNLWGANLAVSAEMFRKYGGFDTRFGRIPGKLYSGEELEFLELLLKNREKVLYHPRVVVRHFIPPERLCKTYFRRLRFDQGELDGLTYRGRSLPRALRSPVRFHVRAARFFLRLAAAALLGSEEKFQLQLKLIYALGFLKGRMAPELRKTPC